ncbi:chemotaxis protein CheW [bacterium]|nr:chemotaxis protein CheW [bacterium]
MVEERENRTNLTPEKKREILRERARELAATRVDEQLEGICLEIVEFQLAHQRYGIEAMYIHEIFHLRELLPLPFLPPYILGIINVRGQIFSVMDLKSFFDLPDKGITNLNQVIIVHNKVMEFGILTDAIIGLHSIPIADIQPPLQTLSGIQAEYLRGFTRDRLVILDIVKILLDEKIGVNQEV